MLCALFILLRKNTFKDLQPEKSGLQYKSLVLILNVVYECIVSNETTCSFKQLRLEIKSYSLFLEIYSEEKV